LYSWIDLGKVFTKAFIFMRVHDVPTLLVDEIFMNHVLTPCDALKRSTLVLLVSFMNLNSFVSVQIEPGILFFSL
jgi:hypothetical protein